MVPLPVLQTLYDYNYWARDQQLRACAALSEEKFLRPLGSSFSSVRDTLAHLVAVEWVWLERCKGHSPTRAEAAPWAAETFPTLAVVEQRWRDTERGWRDYLRTLTPEQLLQPLSYTNIAGKQWTYPLWQILIHLVNHQTYHRGQITTLLRQLGVPATEVDLLVAFDSGQVK
ncbi:MAG TPA: DinB family protein [Candidatus Xenobia bacterium]|nr:DinB family protein [Candidatus Xenobia bacterium]